MKKGLLLLIAMIASLGLSAQSDFNRGMDHVYDFNSRKARPLFEKMVLKDPLNPKAYVGLGWSNLIKGKTVPARKYARLSFAPLYGQFSHYLSRFTQRTEMMICS